MSTESPVPALALSQSRLVPAAENSADNHKIDFSTEHTNGRMFEQAVQNANKTHETSAPPDNVRYSDSKVDQDARPRNDKPLVLKDKNPKQEKEFLTNDKPAVSYTGEEAIWQALLQRTILSENLSGLSRDLVALNGRKMDALLNEKHVDTPAGISCLNNNGATRDDRSIKIGAHGDIHLRQSRRDRICRLSTETYHDLLKIEGELGNHIKTSLIKELDARRFGADVLNFLFA